MKVVCDKVKAQDKRWVCVFVCMCLRVWPVNYFINLVDSDGGAFASKELQ